MPGRRRLAQAIVDQVRERAQGLCEYCHTAEQWQYVPFTIDHVVPLSAGGTDDPGNLALACFHCNRRKSDVVLGRSDETTEPLPWFNPRIHRWADHFAWTGDGTRVVGTTAMGRYVANALAMNRPRAMAIRAADVAVGRHPPAGDPVVPGPAARPTSSS